MLTVLPDVPPHSPAMAFLAHAWAYRSRAIQASGRRTKETMRKTLFLAIEVGLPFARGDFTWLLSQQRPSSYDTNPCGLSYYITTNTSKNCGEEFYTAAVQHAHTTACHSFEQWKGRRPFFAQGTRLSLGAELIWEGLQTFVTSFDDKQGALTVCNYEKVGRHCRGGRYFAAGYGAIRHRWTITPAMLVAASRHLHPTTGAGV
jgi:hypothetical protein